MNCNIRNCTSAADAHIVGMTAGWAVCSEHFRDWTERGLPGVYGIYGGHGIPESWTK